MKPGYERLLRAVEERLTVVEPGAERTLALVEESDKLQEMKKVYLDGTASGRTPNPGLLEMIEEQERRVEHELSGVIADFAEQELLRRLRSFFKYEQDGALPEETRQRRTRNQINNARHYLSFMRRTEEQGADENRTRDRDAELRAYRLAQHARRAAEDTLKEGRNERRVPPPPPPPPSLAESVRDVNIPYVAFPVENKDTKAGGTGGFFREFFTALQSADLEHSDAPGDQIASATRDLLINTKQSSIKFPVLYRSFLSSALPQLFTNSPNENARMESFRYHLSRAAEQHGLRYAGGKIFRVDAPPADAGEPQAESEGGG